MNYFRATKGRRRKNICAVILALALVSTSLTGCGGSDTAVKDEIISQKATEKGRTQITILVKYGFTINGFEKAVEEKFPDIDIVQVGNYTSSLATEGYESLLKNDDLTDVVMTWPLDVGEEYWDDRLMDLSGMDFTSKYNISMLDSISKDGKLYYLPGPSQIRGIVYNKTLFKEKGWEMPKSYKEFVSLCKTIEKSGMRSLQLGLQNSEVLDTALMGYGYNESLSKPADAKWMKQFNEGKGSFGEQFEPALKTFKEMTDAGIWKAEDLNVHYGIRENMLFSRKCAMVEDSVLLTSKEYTSNNSKDDFALMPFWNPGQNADWARLFMVCYIGLNKHLQDSENKDKYDLVVKLMDYISTTDGQKALSSDTGAMYSSVTGASLGNVPEIEGLKPALSQGRYAVFPTLERSQGALHEGLAGMLQGKLTTKDVIAMVDKQNKKPVKVEPPETLGTVKESFSLIETGNYLADVMRKKAGTDVALFLDNGKDGSSNGYGLCGRLYKGEVTSLDIDCLMPDFRHNGKGVLCNATMTGKQLLHTLEYALPEEILVPGSFYYFSGLKMEYAPTAKIGKRIKNVTTSDGSKIDPKKTYTVAIMDKTVAPNDIKKIKFTNETIASILSDSIKKSGKISPEKNHRLILIKK